LSTVLKGEFQPIFYSKSKSFVQYMPPASAGPSTFLHSRHENNNMPCHAMPCHGTIKNFFLLRSVQLKHNGLSTRDVAIMIMIMMMIMLLLERREKRGNVRTQRLCRFRDDRSFSLSSLSDCACSNTSSATNTSTFR
jgi:hypothetical protein